MEESSYRRPPEDCAGISAAEQLHTRIEQLRTEIAVLLLQRDELQLVRSKRIEAAYLRRFGALELKLCEVFLHCRRAKRRLELLRASINRRQAPDSAAVEESLDREFSEGMDQLTDKAKYLTRTIDSVPGAASLSSAGLRKLKQLYRQAIKALHPDLHPEQTDREARLFQSAVRAYRSCDLEALDWIARAVQDQPDPGPEGEEQEQLQQEEERLRTAVKNLNRKLEELKQTYPLDMQIYLENPDRAAERTRSLQARIAELRQRTKDYEDAAASLLARWQADHPGKET